MLGQWQNYEDLEEKLTLDELILIANTMSESENSKRSFAAALKGIDINAGSGEMVDIRELHIGEQSNDITSLTGYEANKVGLGINQGIGFEEI